MNNFTPNTVAEIVLSVAHLGKTGRPRTHLLMIAAITDGLITQTDNLSTKNTPTYAVTKRGVKILEQEAFCWNDAITRALTNPHILP